MTQAAAPRRNREDAHHENALHLMAARAGMTVSRHQHRMRQDETDREVLGEMAELLENAAAALCVSIEDIIDGASEPTIDHKKVWLLMMALGLDFSEEANQSGMAELAKYAGYCRVLALGYIAQPAAEELANFLSKIGQTYLPIY